MGDTDYNQFDPLDISENWAAFMSPETELNFLADFLAAVETWIDVELPIRQAAAEDFSRVMERRSHKSYWDQDQEMMVWDQAAVVALEFPGILYQSIIISAHTIMERSLRDLLGIYLRGSQQALRGLNLKPIVKRLNDVIGKWGWPSLLCTPEWKRVRQWSNVRNALVHRDGYEYNQDKVAQIQDVLGLELKEAGTGLGDEGPWEIQLTSENCIAMFNDIMGVFNWLKMREHEHKTKRSGEGG